MKANKCTLTVIQYGLGLFLLSQRPRWENDLPRNNSASMRADVMLINMNEIILQVLCWLKSFYQVAKYMFCLRDGFGLLFPLILLSACHASPYISTPSNHLLFISYPDVSGDLVMSSEYSEIMAVNIDSGQVTRFTNDAYKDSHPYWSSDGSKIVFESKRPMQGILAENGPSHLYILDIATKEVNRIDTDLEERYPSIIGSENMMPAWSPTANQIAFVTRIIADTTAQAVSEDNLIIFNLDTNDVESLGTVNNVSAMRWSSTGRHLAYEQSFHLLEPPFVKFQVVLKDLDTGQDKVFGDSTLSFRLGSWSSEGLDLLLESRNNMETTGQYEKTLYNYSLEKDQLEAISSNPETCPSPCIYGRTNDELIVLRSSPEDESIENIWVLQTKENSARQLTFEGKQKQDLLLFRK